MLTATILALRPDMMPNAPPASRLILFSDTFPYEHFQERSGDVSFMSYMPGVNAERSSNFRIRQTFVSRDAENGCHRSL